MKLVGCVAYGQKTMCVDCWYSDNPTGCQEYLNKNNARNIEVE